MTHHITASEYLLCDVVSCVGPSHSLTSADGQSKSQRDEVTHPRVQAAKAELGPFFSKPLYHLQFVPFSTSFLKFISLSNLFFEVGGIGSGKKVWGNLRKLWKNSLGYTAQRVTDAQSRWGRKHLLSTCYVLGGFLGASSSSAVGDVQVLL